ncbi:hypothetical protein J6590_028779 [Homalodisca vitripennis]|nr:hypothetical protein J6590_028779 [Homalodisca vitripennis]
MASRNSVHLFLDIPLLEATNSLTYWRQMAQISTLEKWPMMRTYIRVARASFGLGGLRVAILTRRGKPGHSSTLTAKKRIHGSKEMLSIWVDQSLTKKLNQVSWVEVFVPLLAAVIIRQTYISVFWTPPMKTTLLTVQRCLSKQRNISELVLGDSHARGLAGQLRNSSSEKNILVLPKNVKPEAPFQEITCNHHSIRSSNNKVHAFVVVLHERPVDVSCITEDWLSEEECDSLYIDHFTLINSFCRAGSLEKRIEVAAMSVYGFMLIMVYLYRFLNGLVDVFL